MVATSGEEAEGKGRAFLGVSGRGDVSAACLNQLIPHIQCVMKQGANLVCPSLPGHLSTVLKEEMGPGKKRPYWNTVQS